MRLPSHGKLFLRDNSGQIYCFQIDKTPIYPSDYTVCTINHISPLLPAQSGGCLHQTLGPVTARAGAGARARAWLIVLWLGPHIYTLVTKQLASLLIQSPCPGRGQQTLQTAPTL